MLLLPGIHNSASPQRGSTLLLSLLATVVVVSLSAVFLQLTSSIAKRQTQSTDQKRSFYLAEAGLAESFAGLRSGKSGVIGSEAKPAVFGNGLFWVTTTDLGEGLLALESTGMCGTTLSKLDLVVSLGEASVAALGVFSNGDLSISSGSSLSSFDSDDLLGAGGSASGGSGIQQTGRSVEPVAEVSTADVSEGRVTIYRDIGTEDGARVSTNGNIVISQNSGALTQVLGDLRPGMSGSLTLNGSPSISGSTASLPTAVKLPPVDIPIYTQRPGYIHSQAQPLVLPATNGSYQFLGVSAGTELTLTGPSIIVLGQLVVEAGAQVTFDTESGPIEIYVTNKLNLKAGSNLDVTSKSSLDLSIQVTSSAQAEVGANCDFYGTLYAPNAELVVQEDFHIYGSVVADQLTLEGACQMSFDAALGRAAELDALPVLVSWRILEMNPNAAPSGDPFASMGLVRSNLDAPNKSHEDQILEIRYVNASGTDASFSGWESDFNWTDVGQVLNLTRDGASTGKIEGLASIGSTGDGTGLIGVTDRTKLQTMTPSRITRLKSL